MLPVSFGKADVVVATSTPPVVVKQKVLSDVEKVAEATGYKPQTIQKILDCESGDNQSARHINLNQSIDIGSAQINSIWIPLAQKLGFNLLTREGNLGFMTVLIKQHGLRDYKASEWCWKGSL